MLTYLDRSDFGSFGKLNDHLSRPGFVLGSTKPLASMAWREQVAGRVELVLVTCNDRITARQD